QSVFPVDISPMRCGVIRSLSILFFPGLGYIEQTHTHTHRASIHCHFLSASVGTTSSLGGCCATSARSTPTPPLLLMLVSFDLLSEYFLVMPPGSGRESVWRKPI